ncbi:MAG: hypothetical protein JJT96_09695 [Opitutales bacterium]|nr:hypothetical protein [Opitutales bacterium]
MISPHCFQEASIREQAAALQARDCDPWNELNRLKQTDPKVFACSLFKDRPQNNSP